MTSGDLSIVNGEGSGVKKRDKWQHQLDFVFSLIGYCVGLGNLWRFPYKCYRNGGGAFLIPYFSCLFLAGLPLLYLEVSLGQFTSRGPMGAFELAPLFKGIGFGMVIICALVSIYYNVIIAWILYYFYSSLTKNLPWATCDNEWNTKYCSNNKIDCQMKGGVMIGYDCIMGSAKQVINQSEIKDVKWVQASQEFWKHHVLGQTNDILEFGGFQWHLVICLAVAWILVNLCMLKGIKSSGKVVWGTSTLPYVLLLALLVQALLLDGASDGIRYYLTPQWDKLLEPSVWADAAQQIFFSLGLAFGSLMTMASYNKFRNNVARDAWIVCSINCFTSVLGGFVVFAVIGFMARETGHRVDDVASEGAGLAFVVFPEALVRLPGSSLWSALFFLMFLSLGLDSQFAQMEGVTTAVFDYFPRSRAYRPLVVAGISLAMFIIALPMVTQSGIYWFTIFDNYSCGLPLMIMSLLETGCVAYVYGINRFSADIQMMIGSRPGIFIRICWVGITPVLMSAIFLFNMYNYSPAFIEGAPFPLWADLMGWGMSLLSILMVPLVALVELFTVEGSSFSEKLSATLRPSEQWGPADHEDRMEYEQMKRSGADFKLDERDYS